MLAANSVVHWLSDVDPERPLIYHYTSALGLFRILESRKLRMGTYDGMNDPREAKEWVAEQLLLPPGKVTIESLTSHHEVQKSLDRMLRGNARLACFAQDDSTHSGTGLFHRGWARASMWDRYAQRHQGARLVFDRDEFIEAFEEFLNLFETQFGSSFSDKLVVTRTWGSVVYADKAREIQVSGTYPTPESLFEALDEMTNDGKVISQLYMTKNQDWMSEREFRVVAAFGTTRADFELIVTLPLTSLKAIIVGEAHAFPRAIETLVSSNIPHQPDILRCGWFSGAPVLGDLHGTS